MPPPRVVEQPAVQAALVGQLRMEGDGEHVALAHRDRMTVDLGQHLHLVAVVLDPGGADEDASSGSALEVEVGLERRDLPAERVPPHVTSSRPRCRRSSMISPAQVPRVGVPRAHELDERLGQRLALDRRASSWCTRLRG